MSVPNTNNAPYARHESTDRLFDYILSPPELPSQWLETILYNFQRVENQLNILSNRINQLQQYYGSPAATSPSLDDLNLLYDAQATPQFTFMNQILPLDTLQSVPAPQASDLLIDHAVPLNYGLLTPQNDYLLSPDLDDSFLEKLFQECSIDMEFTHNNGTHPTQDDENRLRLRTQNSTTPFGCDRHVSSFQATPYMATTPASGRRRTFMYEDWDVAQRGSQRCSPNTHRKRRPRSPYNRASKHNCEICQRSFSRSDAKLRHMKTLHANQ
ncbi:hypothetical protein EC973_000027 [Apophysomyces ossiformis]|uniref:C2H2-type domain-containing protein n=1 Tax=Apophysomyces ossiformis TaxID=679940 RepID=A0A8H7BZR7_9FUNG|nr:hypothetical protein EC973_000027 [Apophysomyces ossiformis]